MEPPHGSVVVHQRAHGWVRDSVPCFDDAVAVLFLEQQKVLLVVVVSLQVFFDVRGMSQGILFGVACNRLVPLGKDVLD